MDRDKPNRPSKPLHVATRPAIAADTEFARRTHHRAYRDVVEQQFGPWVEQDQDGFFRDHWRSSPFEIVLCDGVPCGYVCIEDREHAIHIRELVIVPDYQGIGIGTTLLRQAMERGRERRVPVRLGTFHHNRALQLYHRLGFREIGRTETHVLLEWPGETNS